jgi:hypothetical protein
MRGNIVRRAALELVPRWIANSGDVIPGCYRLTKQYLSGQTIPIHPRRLVIFQEVCFVGDWSDAEFTQLSSALMRVPKTRAV